MLRTRAGLALAFAFGLSGTASAQTTYTWNSTTSDWGTGTAWSPTGPPTGTDTARFIPTGAGPLVSVVNPNVAGSQAALSLIIAPNQQFGGWAFGGAGSLTIGGTGSTGVTTYGPATYTFDGPTLAGSSGTNTIGLNVGGGSTLTLQGNSAVTSNQGNIRINGGRLRLDNSLTNVAARVQSTGSVFLNGGGTLDFIGNAAGTSTAFGALDRADNSYGGTNTIRVNPNGGAAVLTFANAAGSLRGGTRTVLRFETTSGQLGDATGAQIKFTGTPTTSTQSGGLLTNAANTTAGWAIVSDSNGVNFATYNGTGTAGLGIVSAAHPSSGVTITPLTDSVAGANSTAGVYQLNISAGTTVTAGGAATASTVRISPGAGATLAMGANNLAAQGIMLDGPNDFAITGTGSSTSGSGTHYFYVNNPDTILSIGNQFTGSNTAVVFAGPGGTVLTGSGLQNASGNNNNRITVADGFLRATNAQFDFTSTGGNTRGVLNLFGGVLEIAGGANGTGASADFIRPLGTTAGSVNWGGTNADRGSGGFSAFGNAASVNIGGNATPTALLWASATNNNFVADGYALRFGSRRSNAVLTFLNPIQLDNGTTGAYQLREVNVADNIGSTADRTVLAGAVTGSNTTDFIKTGTGVLVLGDAFTTNTYAGNTLVREGTLVAASPTSSTGTGNVIVGGLGTLSGGGTIDPTGSNAVTVLPGGVLAPTAVDGGVGVLTINGPVNLASGSVFRVVASSPSTFSVLVQGSGTDTVSLNGASLQFIGLGGFNPATSDRLVLIQNAGALSGTFGGLIDNATGTTFDGGYTFQVTYDGTVGGALDGGTSVVLYNFTPVPEPTALLGVAAVGLGLVRLVRRRK